MASNITLSAGIRQNLLSLQNTALLLGQTQERLATGRKVNSALDNPNNFFTSQALQARGSDLSALLDAMGNAVQTLKAADIGIGAITDLVEAGKALANQAMASNDAAVRADLAAQFDDLLTQIDQLATDASFNGVNLLDLDDLEVVFNEDASSSLTITGVDASTGGDLGISAAAAAWVADANIQAALDEINATTTGLGWLRTQAATFGSNLTVVQARQDFTKNLINTLQVGADNLVLADVNEESANMLALQTRQQLSTVALSLAAQADQAVLRLF
jgi:flagellin-like hook-associated protein FlgL